jgi:hypothetical protein
MSNSLNYHLGREALRSFFCALMQQRAFWYLALLPMEQHRIDRVSHRFPSLSQLMNIEEDTLQKVLLGCKLVQKNSKAAGTGFLSPSLNAWDCFVKEYGLDVEWTPFKVDGKQHFFLRIGSWNERCPCVTPRVVLRHSTCEPPRLRISRITMFFVATIGEMELSAVLDPSAAIASLSDGEKSNGSSMTENASDSEEESNVEEVEGKILIAPDSDATKAKLADPQEFPFLHSLGICTEKQMDRLVHEILKFHGTKAVTFKRMNNHEGTLLLMPFATNLKRYEIKLSKHGLIIDSTVDLFANNSNCSLEDSAQCILKAFCKKIENSFAAAAIEKGMVLKEKEDQMDVISTEAMLSEAGITVESSRIIF